MSYSFYGSLKVSKSCIIDILIQKNDTHVIDDDIICYGCGTERNGCNHFSIEITASFEVRI